MPDWKPEIRQRLAGLQLAPTREAAVVEELAQHLDDYYAELLASGALSMREIVMTSSLRHRHKQTLAIAALLCAMASAWLFYGHKATAQTQTSNAPSQPSSARKAGEVVITRAELTGPNGEKLPYELGTVFVPENRSNPRSRLIGVASCVSPSGWSGRVRRRRTHHATTVANAHGSGSPALPPGG